MPVAAPAAIPEAAVVTVRPSVSPAVPISATVPAGSRPITVPASMLPVVEVPAIVGNVDVVKGVIPDLADVGAVADVGPVADAAAVGAQAAAISSIGEIPPGTAAAGTGTIAGPGEGIAFATAVRTG